MGSGTGPVIPSPLAFDQRAIVLDEPFERLPGEVDAVIFGVAALQLGDDAQRLRIVIEAAIRLQNRIQRILAGMAERRVAEIMHQRHAFREVLVELQRACERPGDLRHLDGVGKPRAIVIAVGG
jgi:hypothetical protein